MKILGTIQNELDAVNKQYVDGIIEGLNLGNLSTKNSLSFAEITSKPTTLSGYGIGDAVIWDTNMGGTDAQCTHHLGYGYPSGGWYTAGPTISFGVGGYYAQIQTSNILATPSVYLRATVNGEKGEWLRFLFDKGNYNIEATRFYSNGQLILHRNGEGTATHINYGPYANDETSALILYGDNIVVYARNDVFFYTPKIYQAVEGNFYEVVHGGNLADKVSRSFYSKTESDSKYLPLSGGTITNTLTVTGVAQTPLKVAATSNVGSFIAFTDVGNGTLGSLGVSADRKPTFITYSGATHELLHKNNLDSCNVSINFYDLSDYHDANLSQAEMNSFGLTTAVINNLKDGKYNKVLDTRDTQVWDYTVDGDKISFKCCNDEVMITKESDGTWYIEFL